VEARIYRPAKSVMQSGRGKAKQWVLEFEAEDARRIDSLMGWTGSSDTAQQVCLSFDTKEAAVAFAEARGISYSVDSPHDRKVPIRAYADNFRFDKPH
jgi:hypothetical protein